MMSWYKLILLCTVTTATPCGLPSGCICSDPILYLISCTNISVFPIFEDVIRPGVIDIILYQTRLVALPVFTVDMWPSLKHVDVRNNSLLQCSSIVEILGLRIVSDCPPDDVTPIVHDDVTNIVYDVTHSDYATPFVLICCLFVLMLNIGMTVYIIEMRSSWCKYDFILV